MVPGGRLLKALAARSARAPAAPSRLRGAVVAAGVKLTWKASKGAVAYEVLRNGKRLARTKKRSFTDKTAKRGHHYAYAVRAVDKHGRRSKATRRLTVSLPKPGAAPTPPTTAGVPTAPGSTSGGVPAPAPDPGPAKPTLTAAMVDRVFWRAGFGPSPADRAAWTGKPVEDLVEHLLSTPQSYEQATPAPLTQTNQPIDPTASREELVMEWVDAMQRAGNPLTERLTFFLHRHWAVTSQDGIDPEFMLAYRNRLRHYADLAANPASSLRELASEMTTSITAMSLFLNSYQNSKYGPNENYAREFMELFCLGVRDGAGNDNYTQSDVSELAKAFTGWRLEQNPDLPTYGAITFSASRFANVSKTIFGQTRNWGADPAKGSGTDSAVDLVLNRPAHAAFIARKLWAEFIVTPIPDDALAACVAAYQSGPGFQLKPLVRTILTHPLLFESIDEPNMVKPPVVYWVGVARALGAPQKWFWSRESLQNMQQIPFEPPNVAGWEGGLSWLNTNTVQARFDAVLRQLMLKHRPSAAPPADQSSGYPGAIPIADVPAETAAEAFDRAYAACGAPWLSDGSRGQIQAFAAAHPASTATYRLQRQYALRTLILGGPDGQVM